MHIKGLQKFMKMSIMKKQCMDLSKNCTKMQLSLNLVIY